MFDASDVRLDFPLLKHKVHDQPLVYLDNAATTQKPQTVLDAVVEYYTHHNANVHRGVHTLSDLASTAWETAREQIATFFGAQPTELIMVRNTTEALNAVAYGWGLNNLKPNDVVISSLLEHHSNLVVWQQLCQKQQARLELVSLTPEGQIDLGHLQQIIESANTVKLLSFSWVSNTTGAVLDLIKLDRIITIYEGKKKHRPLLAIDAAQAAPHLPIAFDQSRIDFLAFSGHKLYGPMGCSGLLVKEQLLSENTFQPWLFGGGMIEDVQPTQTTFHSNPTERFTAGTPDVAGAVGLSAALAYVLGLGKNEVLSHHLKLLQYAWQRLSALPAIQVIGPAPGNEHHPTRLGSVAFVPSYAHAHDVAQALDRLGIAVRSGYHCTQPLHETLGWQPTVRASFGVYNTLQDIDTLIAGLHKAYQIFGSSSV